VLTARDGVDDASPGSTPGRRLSGQAIRLEELLARLSSTAPACRPDRGERSLVLWRLSLDLGSRRSVGGREIELTRMEFLLLELFCGTLVGFSAPVISATSGTTTSVRPRIRSTSTSATCVGNRSHKARADYSNSPRRRLRPSGMSSPRAGPLETRGGWLGGGTERRDFKCVRASAHYRTRCLCRSHLVSASHISYFATTCLTRFDGTLTSQAETLNNAARTRPARGTRSLV